MTSERTMELIQADVDGELDAAGRAELERSLHADADARRLHEDLLRIAAALQRMPPAPAYPDLHDRLAKAIDSAAGASRPAARRWLRWRRIGASSREAPTRSNFFAAAAYNSHRHDQSTSTTRHVRGNNMNNRTIIAVGSGLAVAIAAVLYFGVGYPPAQDEVSGTIAPAQRYRAPTIDERRSMRDGICARVLSLSPST